MVKQAKIFSFFSGNRPTPTCSPFLEAKQVLDSLLLLVEKNLKRSSTKKRLVSNTNNSLDLNMTIDKVSVWQKELTFLETADGKMKVFLLFQNQPHRDVT